MSRWSMLVAMSVVACVGIGVAGEGSAAADCSARTRVVVRGRVARSRHLGREVQVVPQPARAPAAQAAGSFELYDVERVNARERFLPGDRASRGRIERARDGVAEHDSLHACRIAYRIATRSVSV